MASFAYRPDADGEMGQKGGLPRAPSTDSLAGLQGGAGVGARTRTPGAVVRDGSAQSMLVFQGAVAVHGLFDYLIQDTGFQVATGGGTEGWADVPLLLAPTQFECAVLHRPQVKVG